MKRTGPTNPQLVSLISELKKKAIVSEQPFWKRIAVELERPTRNRRVVNLSRIDRSTDSGDFIVIPGKVLSSGELSHELTVAAWQFSDKAAEKIAERKGKAISLHQLLGQDVKGKKIKIIG